MPEQEDYQREDLGRRKTGGELLEVPRSLSGIDSFFSIAVGMCYCLNMYALRSSRLLLLRFSVSFGLITSVLSAPFKEQSNQDAVPEGLAATDWDQIRWAREARRHDFRAVDGGFEAWQPGQQWLMRFDAKGFRVRPETGGWDWGLELKSYGPLGQERSQSRPAVVSAGNQRLSYDWGDGLEEWFLNDERGLEHGFTVKERPCREASPYLTFSLGVRGRLRPVLSENTQDFLFQDDAGATVLTYSGLKAWDADGRVLTSRFEAADGKSIRLVVDVGDARYPLTIDPIVRQAHLKASTGGSEDGFGAKIALSGNTLVVSAPFEDSGTTGVNSTPDETAPDSGAVYVFLRNEGVWTQEAYLKASNTGEGDIFGSSVAISGDTIVVGAAGEDSYAGAVYVFQREGTTWAQSAYLKASNAQGGDEFGSSVSISGDTIVVGARFEGTSRAGAAYVFSKSGALWSQTAYLKASNSGDFDTFGGSVAISGDTILVGALGEASSSTGVNSTPNNDFQGAGAAYVFVRSGASWTQQAYLKASNTGRGDSFGSSVAISGDTVIVGAPFESFGGIWAGAAYVFARTAGAWTQQAYLKASNTSGRAVFGNAVAISGVTAIVGSPLESRNANGDLDPFNAFGTGAAYIFVRSGEAWTELAYLKAKQPAKEDYFGRSVAISGDTISVGADGEDSLTASFSSAPNQIASFSNVGGAHPFKIPPLDIWRQIQFGISENSGIAGNEEDPDGDGWKNLLEYGTITNPHAFTDTDITLGLQTYSGIDYLRSIFIRDPTRNDVTIRVETAASLSGPWTAVASSINGAAMTGAGFVSETDLAGGLKQVEVRDTVSSSAADRRFLRIAVKE